MTFSFCISTASQGLLFLNSTRRHIALYENLASQLTRGQHRILTVARLNRVLLDMETASFTNIGMKSRVHNNSVESYRIIAGSNGQIAISPTDGRLPSRSRPRSCANGDQQAERRLQQFFQNLESSLFADSHATGMVRRRLAEKMARRERVVTNTSLDNLAVGKEVEKFQVRFCALNGTAAYSKPTILEVEDDRGEVQKINLLDLELKVNRSHSNADVARLEVKSALSFWKSGFHPRPFLILD
jgi:hypothetical protein